jgi:four helix bundle protein
MVDDNCIKSSGKQYMSGYLVMNLFGHLCPRLESERKFDLEERLLRFSDRILTIVETLPENKICNHLGGQLLRSGTSPTLNYGEAQSAESLRDFIHKFRVILKELRETAICLKMLHRRSIVQEDAIIKENIELISIFVKSIATARGKEKNSI